MMRSTSCIAAAIALGIAVGGYAWFGAAPQLAEIAQWQTRIQAAQAQNTPASWATLGAAYREANAFPQSAAAYKRAVVLSGGAPPLILRYAEALILEAGGEVTDAATRALDTVRLIDAANPEVRYFLAMRALQQGHTAEAMREMKALYRSLPEADPLRHLINRQIGRE